MDATAIFKGCLEEIFQNLVQKITEITEIEKILAIV